MPLTKRGGWPYSNPPNTQFTLNMQSPQSQGLVGWWPTLGQGYGNALRNYARRYDGAGTFNGDPSWITGAETGAALDYDGNDYVSCAQSSDWISSINAFSVCAWCRTSNLAVDQRAVSKWGAAQADRQFVLWMDTDGGADGWSFIVAKAGPVFVSAGTTAATALADTWQLVIGTWDGISVSVYVDGVLADSTIGAGAMQAYIAPIEVGRMNDGAPQYFVGQIADVRVYNRALSAGQVWALYDPATRWELYAPIARLWTGLKAPGVRGGRIIRTKRGGWPYSNPPNTQFTLNMQSPQAQGLVAWWPFIGDRGGPAARDRIRGLTPSFSSVPTWNSTIYGPLPDYAETRYVPTGQPASYYGVGGANARTVSCWAYSREAGITQSDGIFQMGSNVAHQMFALRTNSTIGNWRVNLWTDDIDFSYGGINQWILFHCTYDGTTVSAYADGQIRNSSAVALNTNDTTSLQIGRYLTHDWDGYIFDFRVYNRALSAAEVWAMYNQATRWELYAPAISPGIVYVAAGISVPLFMHHYRQMRIGNGL